MNVYRFWRNAIVAETYEVTADSEEEAREILQNGMDPVDTEWMDWATDNFELEDVEILDPLYRMVKDYEPEKS